MGLSHGWLVWPSTSQPRWPPGSTPRADVVKLVVRVRVCGRAKLGVQSDDRVRLRRSRSGLRRADAALAGSAESPQSQVR